MFDPSAFRSNSTMSAAPPTTTPIPDQQDVVHAAARENGADLGYRLDDEGAEARKAKQAKQPDGPQNPQRPQHRDNDED